MKPFFDEEMFEIANLIFIFLSIIFVQFVLVHAVFQIANVNIIFVCAIL